MENSGKLLNSLWERDGAAVAEGIDRAHNGGAIAQIRRKQYCESLKDYHGNLLLCGINYESKAETKTYNCVIETIKKMEK